MAEFERSYTDLILLPFAVAEICYGNCQNNESSQLLWNKGMKKHKK
jgi:hypothetical protein